MEIFTETISNNMGHFVILKNPNERTGNHVRRSGEAWMRVIIDKLADKTKSALDIGSCFGLHSLYMSQNFKSVFAFEPQKLIAELSKRTFVLNDINNVTVFNIACSNSVGSIDFPDIDYAMATNIGGLSAAYKVGPDRNTNAGWDGSSTISIPSNTIDALMLESLRDGSIGFIKIDVEGFEYKVLKGAEQTLKAFLCPLAIELKDFPEGNLDRVHDLLMDIGYTDCQSVGNSKWDYLYTAGVKHGSL